LAAKENPLWAAHRIHALNGVRYFGLTPDFLDDPKKLVWAHRRVCNRKAELGFAGTLVYLWQNGVRDLPTFLPESFEGMEGLRRGAAWTPVESAGHGRAPAFLSALKDASRFWVLKRLATRPESG
jgi:hypothetical protein